MSSPALNTQHPVELLKVYGQQAHARFFASAGFPNCRATKKELPKKNSTAAAAPAKETPLAPRRICALMPHVVWLRLAAHTASSSICGCQSTGDVNVSLDHDLTSGALDAALRCARVRSLPEQEARRACDAGFFKQPVGHFASPDTSSTSQQDHHLLERRLPSLIDLSSFHPRQQRLNRDRERLPCRTAPAARPEQLQAPCRGQLQATWP